MKDLVIKSVGVVAALGVVAVVLLFVWTKNTPDLPTPDKVLAVDALVGEQGCLVEKWQFPYKYKTINAYLRDNPDAKPLTTITTACEIKGLSTDIPPTETFASYNSPAYDFPVINL